jgi:hypothetical protein
MLSEHTFREKELCREFIGFTLHCPIWPVVLDVAQSAPVFPGGMPREADMAQLMRSREPAARKVKDVLIDDDSQPSCPAAYEGSRLPAGVTEVSLKVSNIQCGADLSGLDPAPTKRQLESQVAGVMNSR